MEDKEDRGARINLRLSESQYKLMKQLGGVLGIELDSQCAKHFFVMGLQASMGALATSQSGALIEILKAALTAPEGPPEVVQTDLIEDASRARA